MEKYIILFDNNCSKKNINLLKKYDFKIIRFLSFYESKIGNEIEEIYGDELIEENYIKNCNFIIFLSEYKKENLIEYIEKYNKFIIFNDLKKNIDKYNSINNELILKSINKFKIYFSNIDYYKMNEQNFNIKMKIKKDEKKIKLITIFKNSDKINNYLQKKCIIENLKNEYFDKIIIICNDNIFLEDLNNDKIEYIKFNNIDNISYGDIFQIINEKYDNCNICLARPDIIILNLKIIKKIINLIEDKIFCLTRIERLLNGEFKKLDLIKDIESYIEFDVYIFKSSINIDLNKIKNLYFLKKYNELYLNKFLSENYKLCNNLDEDLIIRLLYDNNIENRYLISNNNCVIDKKNIELIPNNCDINLDNFIKNLNLSENELYELKTKIINDNLKNYIFK